MSILELGALGEFVGAFAVVATLIYVVVQLHQHVTSNKAAAISWKTAIQHFIRLRNCSNHSPSFLPKLVL